MAAKRLITRSQTRAQSYPHFIQSSTLPVFSSAQYTLHTTPSIQAPSHAYKPTTSCVPHFIPQHSQRYRPFATSTSSSTSESKNDNDDSKEPHQGLIHKYVQPSSDNSVDIQINVLPASRRSQLVEVTDDGIVMKCSASSTDSKDGNQEVVKYMSDVLKLPKDTVSVKDGYDSSRKIINVKLPPNLKRDDVEDRLAQAFTSFPLGL